MSFSDSIISAAKSYFKMGGLELWDFKTESGNDKTAFLNLRSIGGTDAPKAFYHDIKPLGSGLINVVDDFYWNTQPLGFNARNSVPFIRLKEKKLKFNALYAQIAYGAATFGEASINFSAAMAETGKKIADGMETKDGNATPADSGFFGGLANAIGANANSFSDALNGKLSSIANLGQSGKYDKELSPYSGLYITEDTKFTYIFPYYTGDYMNNVLRTEQTKDNFATGAANLANKKVAETYDYMGMSSGIEQSVNISNAAVGASQGQTFEIKFMLYNTMEYEHVIKNWKLLFMLRYQNNIGKVTRSLVDLPVIYEVSLPGNQFIPYAYMQAIQVTNLGTQKYMQLKDVYTDPETKTLTSIMATIPEAWEVTIKMTSLVTPSKNLIHYGLRAGNVNTNPNDIINIVGGLFG